MHNVNILKQLCIIISDQGPLALNFAVNQITTPETQNLK